MSKDIRGGRVKFKSRRAKVKPTEITMEKLGQIPTIKQKIGTASRTVIVAMHKFIFGEDGDRNNRRRLREFRGFEFNDDAPEFRAKLQYAVGFSIGDLISICNVLGIVYTGNAEQLRERIVRALMDVGSLQSVCDGDEDDEDDDDESNDEDDGDAGAEEENENIIHAEQENIGRSERDRRQRNTDNSTKQFVLNYRDVEDSVRSFNGTDSYSIERWINDFEEAATMFGWDNLQKLVFAKKIFKRHSQAIRSKRKSDQDVEEAEGCVDRRVFRED